MTLQVVIGPNLYILIRLISLRFAYILLEECCRMCYVLNSIKLVRHIFVKGGIGFPEVVGLFYVLNLIT